MFLKTFAGRLIWKFLENLGIVFPKTFSGKLIWNVIRKLWNKWVEWIFLTYTICSEIQLKTTLSIETLALLEHFPKGVWWIVQRHGMGSVVEAKKPIIRPSFKARLDFRHRELNFQRVRNLWHDCVRVRTTNSPCPFKTERWRLRRTSHFLEIRTRRPAANDHQQMPQLRITLKQQKGASPERPDASERQN